MQVNLTMSFARVSQLSWCIVCGQAVVGSASGPIGLGVRIDAETIVHEHCFKCSSCHRRLSLDTYRKDLTDQRFYCGKHHNGFAVVGSTQSLPRERSLYTTQPVQLTARSPGGLSPRTGVKSLGSVSPKAATISRSQGRRITSTTSATSLDRLAASPSISRRVSAPGSPVTARSPSGTPQSARSSRSLCTSPTPADRAEERKDTSPARPSPPVPTKASRPALSVEDLRHNEIAAIESEKLATETKSEPTPVVVDQPTTKELTITAESREADEGTVADDSYLQELRKFKRRCEQAATQLESGGDSLHASPNSCDVHSGSSRAVSGGSTTPRQFKRLPIPQEWSCDVTNYVQPVYGYVTEATGSPKTGSKRRKAESMPRSQSPTLMRRLSDHSMSKDEPIAYQIEKMPEDAYEEYFAKNDHWTFYTLDEPGIGPCVLSLKQENTAKREHFRVVVRSKYALSHGRLPATCLLANRYNRDDVVHSLGKEMGFVSRLKRTTSPKASDTLVGLDKSFNSRKLKVGLLYVESGQTTEEAIFNNQEGSRNFQEFMDEIGNIVTLKDFKGYRGGLDVEHEQTGESSLYCDWSGYEIMYHVSTLLPHNRGDRQQLQKKRHIGNDVVCVVFIDDMHTPFSPTAIRSHFLHTFIVVHCDSISFPKRYRIDVVSRDTVPTFGPPLARQNLFPSGSRIFSDFFLTKLINACRASLRAPKFLALKVRTTSQVLDELTAGFSIWDETRKGSSKELKRRRRGSWLPAGANRPPSPLLDSVREPFRRRCPPLR